MNKKQKLKWAFIGIFLVLLFAAALAVLLCGHFLGWEAVKAWSKQAWEWFNAPLPLVGVSLAMLGGFALTVLKKSEWGKRSLARVKTFAEESRVELELAKTRLKAAVEKFEEVLDTYEKVMEEQQKQLREVCAKSRNKNIRDFGASLPDVAVIIAELKEKAGMIYEEGKETEEAADDEAEAE